MKREIKKAESGGLSWLGAAQVEGAPLFVEGAEAGAGEEGRGVEEGEVEVVEEGAAVAEAGELGGGTAGSAGTAVATEHAAVAADAVGGQVDTLLFLGEKVRRGVELHLAAQGGEEDGGGVAVSFAVREHRRVSGVRVVTGEL